ncbi:fam-a protein [Plasmodium chabaudi chabaudi]|uniref:Fam-a protein n=1 Tax=Plasmodium chabaudi chabaudi TaxID=31271 RepID=A0A077TGP5_PLACU|nr:fam-a protein [Plasmodium chabaudi chabaudi]SCL84437.1 fam-a protein [Plasmodium chabaudi chabaudi]SCL90468.1 fam-a protein [Plasmodium chabaudi chabaudi]VTZ66180.1 fam-a protein [Plasmodium chabaudi chabaudi]|eukprot:XP_016652954.1 fam-a protein [Plasmodium chabaudi chabaudi]
MNKGYIKIALAILAVAGYMQNIAFANEAVEATTSSNQEAKEQKLRAKHTKEPKETEETKKAKKAKELAEVTDLMAESLIFAKKHAQLTDDYNFYGEDEGAVIHFKPVKYTEIGRIAFTIPNADSYGDIVKMLWDPNFEKKINDSFIKGMISRKYNENLAIIQQHYHGPVWTTYYNAIANKVELSEDETVILLVSSDVNDHNPAKITEGMNYVNPIITRANSFMYDVDSDESVIIGRLHKMYLNLVAIFIKKEADGVKITQLASVQHPYIPNTPEPVETLRDMTATLLLNTTKIGDIIKQE